MTIPRLRILSPLQNCILRYNKMALQATCRAAAQDSATREHRRRRKAQKTNMFRYISSIALSLAASVASGAIFLLSLIHQFALVEIAASLVTALQVFFLSSAIADLLEKAKRPSHQRTSLVVLFTVLLVAFYSFTRHFR
jgi:hypothetical protein